MFRTKTAVLCLTMALAVTVACKHPGSDDDIANNIKGQLYSDPLTKTAKINVAVKSGVVTLAGDVPSSDVALEAMKIANGAEGVQSVSDQLTINGQSAANQLPDAGTPQTATNTPPPASSTPNSAPPASAPPPPAPEPQVETVTVPAGTDIAVRTVETIDSNNSQPGQEFHATLASPVVADGRTVIRTGADARLVLVAAKSSGRFEGRPELEVRLADIRADGRTYRVDSSVYSAAGGSRGKQTAERTGIGAAAGAVIGALAGGGKGAAIGAAAGGGAGAGSDFFTHGPRVRIPSESVLRFQLQAPLTLER